MTMRPITTDFLNALTESVFKSLVSKSIHENIAYECAVNITNELANEWGGGNIYIPRTPTPQHTRNAEIYAEFKGNNYAELARKYKLSEVWIRKIIERQRALNKNT